MSTRARPEADVAAISDWRAWRRAYGTPETKAEVLERETGFEPATFCLGSPELVSAVA